MFVIGWSLWAHQWLLPTCKDAFPSICFGSMLVPGSRSLLQLALPVVQADRAASISARLAASSMLLVVTKDLPARMSRPVWNLRDYVVLEKMYTGVSCRV